MSAEKGEADKAHAMFSTHGVKQHQGKSAARRVEKVLVL